MAPRTFNRTRKVLAGTGIVLMLALAFLLLKREPLPVLEVPRSELVSKEGRLFQSGETAPFTGVMIEKYPNGQTMSRSAIQNGILHGTSEGYYTNGVVQVRETFVKGVSEGVRLKWHANGQLQSEAHIASGKISGVFRRWHPNGQLAEEVPMANGLPEGTSRSFYPSGCLQAEATLKAGKVVDQKSWPDGEMKLASAASGARQ